MTKSELHCYRGRLRGIASRLRSEVTRLREEAISAPVGLAYNPTEQADVASHEAEERRTQAVLSGEEFILAEVEMALERIQLGTFGKCFNCDQSINKDRLEALPYARYCYGCAKNFEAAQQ